MKLKKGLAAVLSLVVSTSMIAFAQEDITKSEQTKTPNPIEVLAEEQIIQATTEIEQVVVQPPKNESEFEESQVVVPPAEEPEEIVPEVVPPAEEPEAIVPEVVPPAEEPEAIVPEVVPPAEVPVVVPPVLEVKPATLIVKHILMYQGQECDVDEDVINGLKVGDIANNMKFVRSEKNGYFDIVCLEESQEVTLTEKNEIVIRYNYVGTLNNE